MSGRRRCSVCMTKQTLLISGVVVKHGTTYTNTRGCLGSHKLPLEGEPPSPEARAIDAESRLQDAEDYIRELESLLFANNDRLVDVLRRLSGLPVQKGGFISAAEFGKIMSEVEDDLEN